jgi:predicted transcriptional regulator of viral defense system
MSKFRYYLTDEGIKRCLSNEFYLQSTSIYKGYTEKIFQLLHKTKKPLSIREISELTGIKPRSVNGVLMFNVYAGYVKRVQM